MMKDYFADLKNIFLKLESTDSKGRSIPLNKASANIINLIVRRTKNGNKAIFIGNGGSAAIASHMATDFLKNAQVPSIAFNDPSLITCLSNDLGYAQVFKKPLELLAKKGDILFSISSSGMSNNILKATREAKRKGCLVVTLSGFNGNNSLRKLGDINFYLPCDSYGYVEIAHLIICHCIVDKIIEGKKK